MAKNNIITGLDIGTTSIKIVSVLKNEENSELEILGQAQVPTFGMRKGVVVNPNEVSKRIISALSQIQSVSGKQMEEVYVNIGGSHIYVTPSYGEIVVSRADQNISQEDIERVLRSAQALSLPSNKEILDIFPREFMVDGERGIKQPLGMRGLKLEVEILVLCIFSPYLKNLTQAVLETGVQIADIIPSPLASAKACLTPQQKELGVALIDIGGGTTDLAVYKEGDLVHLAVFPIGSDHITNDIAIGLRTDIEIAEKIKREFGSCLSSSSRKKEKIKLSNQKEPLIFSSKMLAKIIQARISELFQLIRTELKKVSNNSLPAGVVLTGGGVRLPNMVEFAKEILKLPTRISFPSREGLTEDPGLSVGWGLVLNGVELKTDSGFSEWGKSLTAKFKKIFKIFIP